jgi:hypothetical protein
MTSPTSGSRSVGIVCWRTKAQEFYCLVMRITFEKINQFNSTFFRIVIPYSSRKD